MYHINPGSSYIKQGCQNIKIKTLVECNYFGYGGAVKQEVSESWTCKIEKVCDKILKYLGSVFDLTMSIVKQFEPCNIESCTMLENMTNVLHHITAIIMKGAIACHFKGPMSGQLIYGVAP